MFKLYNTINSQGDIKDLRSVIWLDMIFAKVFNFSVYWSYYKDFHMM